MYTDYTGDDILENVSYLVTDVNDAFEANLESWNSLEANYFRLMNKISECTELTKSIELRIESEYKTQEVLIAAIKDSKTKIENLENIVKKLKDLKLKKENDCTEVEATIGSRKDIIQSDLERREKIKRKEDQVIAYKVLTHIDFLYNTRKVTGLVTKDDPVPFSFNRQVTACEEITEKLWDLVLDKKIPEYNRRNNSSINQDN